MGFYTIKDNVSMTHKKHSLGKMLMIMHLGFVHPCLIDLAQDEVALGGLSFLEKRLF
jgi:hypothetical protein